MTLEVRAEDLLHDDENLLADRLLRSLHRNKDGHLAAAYNLHAKSVQPDHNVAVIYCYTVDQDAYTLHQHYLHSRDSNDYAEWYKLVVAECHALTRNSADNFYGVYGWLTAIVQITPLRTGDIFIKIDAEGARGVRLAFNTRKNRHEARKKEKR
jgi:hypothetical protein